MNHSSPPLRLSVRTDERNPDHHLWNNNGTWWCHYTIHRPDHTKQRVRRSLATHDQSEARRRRDCLLSSLILSHREVA